MLYPVRVRINHGQYFYALLTIEQANQRFVESGGCLLKHDVTPMSYEEVITDLSFKQSSLVNAEKAYQKCPNDFQKEKSNLFREIEELKAVIALLTQAAKQYESLKK